ncbi:hypothetical protein [Streptomyces acidiscabies]|uniref:hypothetical protein n=1 Tax=Streptomyces acidiscabies TaxID=42234 RepID=UPI0038F722DF
MGRASYGFGAALLHIYAFPARVAELVVCAQVLQAEDRTAFSSALAGHVREYLVGQESS